MHSVTAKKAIENAHKQAIRNAHDQANLAPEKKPRRSRSESFYVPQVSQNPEARKKLISQSTPDLHAGLTEEQKKELAKIIAEKNAQTTTAPSLEDRVTN